MQMKVVQLGEDIIYITDISYMLVELQVSDTSICIDRDTIHKLIEALKQFEL